MTSIFNTSETALGKAKRIINFLDNLLDKEVIYIGIGKPTPWTNKYGLNVSDINPPIPTPEETTLPEPILYVRAKAGAAIKKLGCDTLEPVDNVSSTNTEILVEQSFNDINYQYLVYDNLLNEDGSFRLIPQYVYITGKINGTAYTDSSWRASGLFTNLVLEDNSIPNKEVYRPDEVKSAILNQITFNTPVLREDNKTHTFEYLVNL